jgi:hypothetical protein
MMPLLASLHAIAAPRGDGLSPELLRLLKRPDSSFGTGLTSKYGGQETHRTPQSESDPVSADASAMPEEILPACRSS